MACNLSSINVSEYVLYPYSNKATIDYISLKKDVETIVSEMDKVLEENLDRHALPEQKTECRKWRNIGIGIMGLSDLFVKLGVRYGSPDSIGIANHLMKTIFREAVIISANNGKIYGNFPGYNPKVWESTIIKKAFTEEEIDEFKRINCLRNCSLLSIAPTGTIGTFLNISTGCEPFFALSYNRRTETMSGETYKVEIKAVEEYRRITGNQGDLPDYFVVSADIPWQERVDMQAALQKFCDTAISSTVNLKADTTIEDIKALYIRAWEKGCKGITVYREGSRDPILSVDKKEPEKQLETNIENAKEVINNTLERGFVIPSGNHWLGLKRTLNTGCGTLHCEAFFDPDSGELRECYLSKGSTGGCNNFMIGLSRMISLAARGGLSIDNIFDQLKSCGVCPSYAVRNATKKDCSKGSCCPVAVGNALREMYEEIQEIICECQGNLKSDIISRDAVTKQFLTNDNSLEEIKQNMFLKNSNLEECPSCHEKTLTRVGGCTQCISCGYSRCS